MQGERLTPEASAKVRTETGRQAGKPRGPRAVDNQNEKAFNCSYVAKKVTN